MKTGDDCTCLLATDTAADPQRAYMEAVLSPAAGRLLCVLLAESNQHQLLALVPSSTATANCLMQQQRRNTLTLCTSFTHVHKC